MPASGVLHGVVQEHIGCGEFVNNSEIAGIAPKRREPSADKRFVQRFGIYDKLLSSFAVDRFSIRSWQPRGAAREQRARPGSCARSKSWAGDARLSARWRISGHEVAIPATRPGELIQVA